MEGKSLSGNKQTLAWRILYVQSLENSQMPNAQSVLVIVQETVLN